MRRTSERGTVPFALDAHEGSAMPGTRHGLPKVPLPLANTAIWLRNRVGGDDSSEAALLKSLHAFHVAVIDGLGITDAARLLRLLGYANAEASGFLPAFARLLAAGVLSANDAPPSASEAGTVAVSAAASPAENPIGFFTSVEPAAAASPPAPASDNDPRVVATAPQLRRLVIAAQKFYPWTLLTLPTFRKYRARILRRRKVMRMQFVAEEFERQIQPPGQCATVDEQEAWPLRKANAFAFLNRERKREFGDELRAEAAALSAGLTEAEARRERATNGHALDPDLSRSHDADASDANALAAEVDDAEEEEDRVEPIGMPHALLATHSDVGEGTYNPERAPVDTKEPRAPLLLHAEKISRDEAVKAGTDLATVAASEFAAFVAAYHASLPTEEDRTTLCELICVSRSPDVEEFGLGLLAADIGPVLAAMAARVRARFDCAVYVGRVELFRPRFKGDEEVALFVPVMGGDASERYDGAVGQSGEAREEGDGWPIVADPVIRTCPRHARKLLWRLEAYHQLAKVKDPTAYPCSLAHNRCFRHLAITDKAERDAGCDFERKFLVCPDDSCGFAICHGCVRTGWFGPFVEQRRYVLVRMGVLTWIGILVIFAAQSFYTPTVRAAILSLFCHDTMACDPGFTGGCYPVTPEYLGLAYISAAVLVFLGVGLVAALWFIIYRRKRLIVTTGIVRDYLTLNDTPWDVAMMRKAEEKHRRLQAKIKRERHGSDQTSALPEGFAVPSESVFSSLRLPEEELRTLAPPVPPPFEFATWSVDLDAAAAAHPDWADCPLRSVAVAAAQRWRLVGPTPTTPAAEAADAASASSAAARDGNEGPIVPFGAWNRFVYAVEANYSRHTPYHNNLHAADVVHSIVVVMERAAASCAA